MRVWGCSLLVLALLARPVAADNLAAAEALFDEGKRLMDAGRFAEACVRLEESQRLDPGTGTLWYLASCYEKTERLASAWAKYLQVAQETRRRGEFAKVQAAVDAAKRLEPRLHRLAIDVPPKHRVRGLTVTRDGAKVGQGQWSTAVPVDRGEHVVSAWAPGHVPWQTTVVVGEESLARVKVPALEETPVGTVVAGPGEWYQDSLGWAALGAGVAFAGVGAGAYFHGQGIEDDARQTGGLPLDQREKELDKARVWKSAGIGVLVLGGAAAIFGGAKLAIHPRQERKTEGTRFGWDVRSGGVVLGLETTF